MNSHSKSQRIAFIALLAAAIVLIAGGIFGVVNRTSASGEQMLSDMRLTALLTTAGEGSKEALVEAEVEAAREAARAAGGGLSEIKEAVAAAEAAAMERVANMTVEVDLDTVDTSALIPAVEDMLAAQRALFFRKKPVIGRIGRSGRKKRVFFGPSRCVFLSGFFLFLYIFPVTRLQGVPDESVLCVYERNFPGFVLHSACPCPIMS